MSRLVNPICSVIYDVWDMARSLRGWEKVAARVVKNTAGCVTVFTYIYRTFSSSLAVVYWYDCTKVIWSAAANRHVLLLCQSRLPSV